MDVKFLIFLSLFLGSSLGQSIQCSYVNMTFAGIINYSCLLNIQNPSGFDNFTTISGEHVGHKTDEDVTALIVQSFSRTVNFPLILCQQFPNLVIINFSLMNVTLINENTLNGCRHIEYLRLMGNNIEKIHENAFSNLSDLDYLDLKSNKFKDLPENVFQGLVKLQGLDLSNNDLETLPAGIFNSLTNLGMLLLKETKLTELNFQWFENLEKIISLSIFNNNISSLPPEVLSNLRNLTYLDISENPLGNLQDNFFEFLPNLEQLYMSSIGATEINRSWFQNLQNLEILYIYSNLFTSISENVFDGLISLWALDIGDNNLTESAIPGNLFDNLTNLLMLVCDYNLVQNLNPDWFRNLNQLVYLDFNFNQVDSLPVGIFAQIDALINIEFRDNNIKTLDRDAFGNIGSLAYVDFDGNVINAIEKQFLREAEPLINFYLDGNFCISTRFYMFAQNRESFMPRLSVCTRNYLFTVETVTEASDQYNFYQSPYPGIQLRVNSPEDVNIALTPFNFPWTPMVEIFIGVGNNTVSRIVRNRDTDVVVVPTPNILEEGRWSGFRVTWSNHVILVSREGQQYPFMAYTLEDFFPVNFYGLRSPQNRAVWSIQPV